MVLLGLAPAISLREGAHPSVRLSPPARGTLRVELQLLWAARIPLVLSVLCSGYQSLPGAVQEFLSKKRKKQNKTPGSSPASKGWAASTVTYSARNVGKSDEFWCDQKDHHS